MLTKSREEVVNTFISWKIGPQHQHRHKPRDRDKTARWHSLGTKETGNKELCMNSTEKVKAPAVQKVNLAGAPVTRVLLSLRFLLVHTLSPQADGLTLNSNQICF